MSILNVENLTFGFGDKILLNDVSFRLLKGEHIGLVGANGAGKTTFLNILIEDLIPDKGSIYKQNSINIGYLNQHSDLKSGDSIREHLKKAFNHLYEVENEILEISNKLSNKNKEELERLLKNLGRLQDILYASDFYNIDTLIDNISTGLGLDILGLDTPVEKLSGGQKTKVKLAQLLLGNPDLLLLDEPTNYLDTEHIDWLSDYLKNYPNSYIIISHDDSFLDRITNVIYHIQFTNLKRYPGNYSDFLKIKDEETKRHIQQYNRQQKEITKLEDYINKNIVRASTSKMAKSRRKKLNKIERIEKPKNLPTPTFCFINARQPSGMIFKSSNMNIGYNYPLISNLNLKLFKGQKIAITGCNGIGKSTLLKTIMGIIEPLCGKIQLGDFIYSSYYEQECSSNDNTALEEVWNVYPKKSQKEIRAALARCGLKQEHIMHKMSQLSGGEQSKVRLCKLMQNPSNWLLLDEPTNHLDVNAKEALKEALIKFNGTILLVCHEKEFYEDWVTDIWDMEDFIMNSYNTNKVNAGM